MVRRSFFALLTLLGGAAAAAGAPAPSPMMRAEATQDWVAAARLAAENPDPLASKLVVFLRLLSPDQASAPEIFSFLAANPSWPDRPVFYERLNDAVATTENGPSILSICESAPLHSAAALQRCAEILAGAGKNALAGGLARRAWVAFSTEHLAESEFLARWGSLLKPADEWARFEHLLGVDITAATAQLARLDPEHRREAAARLAFEGDNKRAMSFLAAVPEALRADPALLLDEARYDRRQNLNAAALSLWGSALASAESEASSKTPYRNERDRMARQLLAAGDSSDALMVADDPTADSENPEAPFLAGWIALRRLSNPGLAAAKFSALARISGSVITQGRAYYWLGRAEAAENLPDQARTDWKKAAAWPTSFYGQQAALALGDTSQAEAARITSLRDPVVTEAQAQNFASGDLVHAAAILVSWGDKPHARDFLKRAAALAPDPASLAAAAQESLRLGVPDAAVAIARQAGRGGVMLPQSGWPAPVAIPPGGVDPTLLLALARQESSFDPDIVSPAGAQGLMQLMPATAADLGETIGVANAAHDLTDPSLNLRLGTVYVQQLLTKFGGCVPYSVAAYNAGPHRVAAWITTNGDAAAAKDSAAMLDWIEQIPFAETRNYVQRVLENQAIYRATANQR